MGTPERGGPPASCLCSALDLILKILRPHTAVLLIPRGKRAQNFPDRGWGEKATAFLPGMFSCPSGRWGRIARFLLQDVRGEGGQRLLLPLLTERFSNSINLADLQTGSHPGPLKGTSGACTLRVGDASPSFWRSRERPQAVLRERDLCGQMPSGG